MPIAPELNEIHNVVYLTAAVPTATSLLHKRRKNTNTHLHHEVHPGKKIQLILQRPDAVCGNMVVNEQQMRTGAR